MECSNIDEYNKNYEVGIDSAIILASLSEDSLKKLDNFIFDYNLFCDCSKGRFLMNKGNSMTFEDFIMFCRSKLVSDDNSYVCNFGDKMYYKSLLRNYKGVIKEFLRFPLEELKKFFDTFDNKFNISSFWQLREYLIDNYDNIDDYLNKFMCLKDLGINGFIFDSVAKIDGNYTMVVLENREMKKMGKSLYGVRGYASDGKITWRAQMDCDGYDFSLNRASYIIKYVKGTAFADEINMVVRDLDFSIDSLPSKEELFDFSVLPNIDFELIKYKTRVVNLVYLQECCLEYARKLLKYNKELRDNLENGGFSKEALEMSKQLIFLESFINSCEKLGNEMVIGDLENELFYGKYNDPLIERKELNNYVAKRRSRDLKAKE